jgi:cyclic pyranopterin phosphate synthase
MRLPLIEKHSVRPVDFESGPASIHAVRVLRISVTDRCNYRCVYCMPEDGVQWLAKDRVLSFEQIEDVARAAIEAHGIRRFKLTGGEPTVRHGIVDLVARLRRIDGIEDLSLTTNGQRLLDLAGPLKESGLDRITVSIDSLNAEKFRRITRAGILRDVLAGLDRAEDVGFKSLKINCVTMRGVNDDEIVDFARLTLNRRVTVRFIEYMPLGEAALMDAEVNNAGSLDADGNSAARIDAGLNLAAGIDGAGQGRDGDGNFAGDFVAPPGGHSGDRSRFGAVDVRETGPAGGCGAQDRGGNSLIAEADVRRAIEESLGPLERVERKLEAGVGPAEVYQLARGNPAGRIGFISAMSAPFCAACNRLRLTADGVLRSCLFEGGEVDVRPIFDRFAAEPSPEKAVERRMALAAAMTDCVRLKPEVHSRHGNQQMSRIGG